MLEPSSPGVQSSLCNCTTIEYKNMKSVIFKVIRGWMGFKKSYETNRVGQANLMFAYKVGGWVKKMPKTCLRNI